MKTKKSGVIWFLFVLIVIVNLFLRWNSFTTPYERDEGEYAYSAWIMRNGSLPYQNSFLQKPPLIIYTYMLGQIISADALWPPRLLSFIFIVISSLLIYKIVKKDNATMASIFASVIFSLIVASPINASLASNTEGFMLLPLIVCLYLYVYYKLSDNYLVWLISGVAVSLAILYKPICVYVLTFIYLYWIYELWKGKLGLVKITKRVLVFILTGILTVFLVLSPFIFNGGLNAVFEQTIVFNSMYASHWGLGLDKLFINLKVMAKSFWIIYLIIIAYFMIRPKNWLFYSGCLLLSLLAVFQTSIRHYYILLMPFIAVMVGYVVSQIPKRSYKIYLLIFSILTILWPMKAQFALSPHNLSLWIYGIANPFSESMDVAGELKKITLPEDRVFVAGSEPQIYFYAKRKSMSRFVITYPLIINTPVRLSYQQEIIEEFKKELPKAIVYTTSEESGLWNKESPRLFKDYIDDIIDKDYYLVGAYVWGYRGGKWMIKPNEEELKKASLILYKLKND